MNNNQRFFWLDVIRGLSAIAVCAGHLRSVMFVDFSQLQTSSLLYKLFYGMTGLGHQAVMVFFVLSGFFVGGSILKRSSKFKWTDYAISRLSRLWIVLIPALLITFAIDQLIAPDILRGSCNSIWNSGPSIDRSYSNTFLTFLGNIFFLQNIVIPVFGTNAPLWSLSSEFWYYVLFPLCAYAVGQCYNFYKPHLILRIGAALIALTIFLWFPGIQLGYFIWLLGVVIYVIYNQFDQSNKITPVLFIFGIIAFIGSLAYSKSTTLQEILNIPGDVIVGLGFSVLCFALLNLPAPPTKNVFINRAARGLSEISYSLYLTHFPFVILIGTLYYRSNQLLPNFNGLFNFLGLLGLLLIISIVFWWVFERNTNILRRFAIEHLTNR